MFLLPDTRQKHSLEGRRSPKSYPNPIFLAREWQRALETGACPSEAALAQQLGVSRARATQVLRLLSLDQEVIHDLAALGHTLPSRIITERRLRLIVNLPPEDQRRKISALLAGEVRLL